MHPPTWWQSAHITRSPENPTAVATTDQILLAGQDSEPEEGEGDQSHKKSATTRSAAVGSKTDLTCRCCWVPQVAAQEEDTGRPTAVKNRRQTPTILYR